MITKDKKSNKFLGRLGNLDFHFLTAPRNREAQKTQMADTAWDLATLARISDNSAERKSLAHSIIEIHKGLAAIAVAELRKQDSRALWDSLVSKHKQIRALQIEPTLLSLGRIPHDELSVELNISRNNLLRDFLHSELKALFKQRDGHRKVLDSIEKFISKNKIETFFGVDEAGIEVASLIWVLAKERRPDLQLGLLSVREEEFWINGTRITPRQYGADKIDFKKPTLGFAFEDNFLSLKDLQAGFPDSIFMVDWSQSLDRAEITISGLIGSPKVTLRNPRFGYSETISEERYLKRRA